MKKLGLDDKIICMSGWIRVIMGMLVISLIVAHSPKARAEQCPRFSTSQKYILAMAYEKGAPFNLGETMRAMAFIESSAGLNLESRTQDYGVMQIHWKTAKRRFPWITKSELKYNHNINMLAAIAELEHWRARRNTWLEIWASYNGGNVLEPVNWAYAHKVRNTIRLFRRCL